MTDINLDTVELKNANVTAIVADKQVSVEVKDKDAEDKSMGDKTAEVLPV